MSINPDSNEQLLYNETDESTKKHSNKIKKIYTFSIINLVFNVLLLVFLILLTANASFMLNKFNGIDGFGEFINKSTIVIDKFSSILAQINQTKAEIYLEKMLIIIDTACKEINCNM